MVPERDKIASNVGEMAVSRALIELIVLSNMGAGFLSLIRVCVCVCVSGGWGGGCVRVYMCICACESVYDTVQTAPIQLYLSLKSKKKETLLAFRLLSKTQRVCRPITTVYRCKLSGFGPIRRPDKCSISSPQ